MCTRSRVAKIVLTTEEVQALQHELSSDNEDVDKVSMGIFLGLIGGKKLTTQCLEKLGKGMTKWHNKKKLKFANAMSKILEGLPH